MDEKKKTGKEFQNIDFTKNIVRIVDLALR